MNSFDELIRLDWDLITLYRQCMGRLMCAHNIYPGQLPLLFTLKRIGACNQTELARAMQISPASTAISLRRLEKSGCIKRAQNPSDLRSNLIELTKEGLAAAEWADHAIYQVNSRKLSGLTEEETAAVALLYQRMRQNLTRFRDELDEISTCKEESL